MTESMPKPLGQPLGLTPSATVGPYFAYGLTPGRDYPWRDLVTTTVAPPETAGPRIRIEGRVIDGDGNGIPDAVVEIWQADASGHYAHSLDRPAGNSGFRGLGRAGTKSDGGFAFDTIKPGAVAGPDGKTQAPHIVVALFARGMLRHLYTRIYFSDEPATAIDPILALVPANRRKTLIAEKSGSAYRYDIRVQGGEETVFFAI